MAWRRPVGRRRTGIRYFRSREGEGERGWGTPRGSGNRGIGPERKLLVKPTEYKGKRRKPKRETGQERDSDRLEKAR